MAATRLLSARPVGETDNLTELENLNESTLLAELKARYQRQSIYCYVGEILVAINPYEDIAGLYSRERNLEYSRIGDRTTRKPHLFAMADICFTYMTTTTAGPKANQVVVISGESGAGKTESAKLFIKHIVYLATKGLDSSQAVGAAGLEEKIIQLNPLLEAWGNAQTLMNDNSSRFGKFVELRFDPEHTIDGALMSDYLLEKSRVVEQSTGEQNFHVFYLFFAGLDEAGREKYALSDPGEHRYINSNDKAVANIDTPRCRSMYAELQQCIKVVGFSDLEVSNLWALLAGVLHTGDIDFAGEDQAYVVSADDVAQKCTAQLGVVADALIEALTTSINITRGEQVLRHYKPHEAQDARDAMAKALYERAFRWIVKRVNDLLGPKRLNMGPNDKSIGILDIFGFECFDSNYFEQLLINLANERLQQFFNDYIFKMELDEYAKEGVDGSKTTYEDNAALLELLLGRPTGLLSLCDEEARVPKGDDKSMVEKFHQAFDKSKNYERPRGNELYFSILHYAGKVTYQAEGFLERNRDTLPIDVIGALRLSDNELVRTLFEGDEEDAKAAKKNKGKRDAVDAKKSLRLSMKKAAKVQAKTKRSTVGLEFKESLVVLMNKMSQATPHFVRCIKPNYFKRPCNFEDELVTKQLRYTGMLETTRIRKEGYAYRPTFVDFLARYKPLGFPFSSNPPATAASCGVVLDKAGVKGWLAGRTKVFLRYYHMDELNYKFMPFPLASQKLTKVARGFLGRRRTRQLMNDKERVLKAAEAFLGFCERMGAGTRTVMLAVLDEDNARPKDYWNKPKSKPDAKEVKAAKEEAKKKGLARMQSVKWFKEVELKKGAGLASNGKFEEWFHGLVTRGGAERLLSTKEPGTFLVRVAESRFGYSLSHNIMAGHRIKHYMVDQTPDGQYQVVGNRKLFASLNELVAYHNGHKVVAEDPVALLYPCGQEGEKDDRLELIDKKQRKTLLG